MSERKSVKKVLHADRHSCKLLGAGGEFLGIGGGLLRRPVERLGGGTNLREPHLLRLADPRYDLTLSAAF